MTRLKKRGIRKPRSLVAKKAPSQIIHLSCQLYRQMPPKWKGVFCAIRLQFVNIVVNIARCYLYLQTISTRDRGRPITHYALRITYQPDPHDLLSYNHRVHLHTRDRGPGIGDRVCRRSDPRSPVPGPCAHRKDHQIGLRHSWSQPGGWTGQPSSSDLGSYSLRLDNVFRSGHTIYYSTIL